MELTYKTATTEDLEALISSRSHVLREIMGLPSSTDMSGIERHTRAYYAQALPNGETTCVLVFDGGALVGMGAICYYRVLPAYTYPTGEKAYIMSMYTHDGYRKRGIATTVLDMLVKDAQSRGIRKITLEATGMGRPVYERYGFVPMPGQMELIKESTEQSQEE